MILYVLKISDIEISPLEVHDGLDNDESEYGDAEEENYAIVENDNGERYFNAYSEFAIFIF